MGSMDDIELLMDFFGDKEIARQETEYFFETGGELFLAFSGNELAGVARLRHYPGVFKLGHPERDPYIEIKKDEVFYGHCETSIKYRRNNIFTVLAQYMLDYSFAIGKKRGFATASPKQKATIRMLEKLGAIFICQKKIFRIFGIKFNYKWSTADLHE